MTLIMLVASISITNAQSDTTIIRQNVYFESEIIHSKIGDEIKYYAVLNGKYYESNKTSFNRYKTIKRLNGTPCVALITNTKTNKKKIIIL